jgi:protoheme IX farnesyltransferase
MNAAMPLVKDVISIFKLRIGVTIMMSAIGGVAVTPGPLPDLWRVALLGIAVFLASASAGAFNQWAEADLDGQMKRTANRPFATGRLKANGAWLAAILGLLAFAVVLAYAVSNAWAAFHTFMGAFVYGIVYTVWLKRRSWTNIVIGGAAGSFAVLAGAAAVDPTIPMEALLLTAVIFLWTPPHFWSLAIAAHENYESAKVPMLPVIAGDTLTAKVILAHTAVLVTLSVIPAFYGMGAIYLVGALSGGLVFVWTSIRLVAEPGRKRAIQNFLASLLQLVLLLTGTIADRAIGALM